MNGTQVNANDIRLIAPAHLQELVRGQEAALVERLRPIVQTSNVTLDLSHVERIDAAGIAALIALYGAAHEAGYHFGVRNANHHVEEVLVLVGLDRILFSCEAAPALQANICCAPAA
jgi:anti-anti-sigma regulatory factor